MQGTQKSATSDKEKTLPATKQARFTAPCLCRQLLLADVHRPQTAYVRMTAAKKAQMLDACTLGQDTVPWQCLVMNRNFKQF